MFSRHLSVTPDGTPIGFVYGTVVSVSEGKKIRECCGSVDRQLAFGMSADVKTSFISQD